ncbi:hypothetical protein DW082_13235 [Alistipes sp. AF48-12]|nr:hypothetical protein DW082_13235 [Alistipes sp. AF48-12]
MFVLSFLFTVPCDKKGSSVADTVRSVFHRFFTFYKSGRMMILPAIYNRFRLVVAFPRPVS